MRIVVKYVWRRVGCMGKVTLPSEGMRIRGSTDLGLRICRFTPHRVYSGIVPETCRCTACAFGLGSIYRSHVRVALGRIARPWSLVLMNV